MSDKTTNISEISTKGKAFVDASGTRFIVRGVALSPKSNADLLADDYSDYMKEYVIPQLTYLNVNVIRVYQIDENKPHKKVMDLLAKNNIYVMVGMVTPTVSVNRMDPKYTLDIYNRLAKIAKEFCGYPNTFAFSVGNEVVFPGEIYTLSGDNATNANNTIKSDAQVMKSMIKDLKKYMRDNNLRSVPVGMAMQDGPTSTLSAWKGIGTDTVAAYYAGGDKKHRADFIGINSYRYVNGKTPGPMSSYNGLATEVETIPVPVFLTESGGFENPPVERDWAIVPEMYKTELSNQLSGQIAFQFFEKGAGFGLYNESPAASVNSSSTDTNSVTPLSQTKLGGAANLSTEFKNAKDNVPAMPPTVADPSTCPKACDPSYVPCPAPTINITVENYSDVVIKAVQGGTVLATLPAKSGPSPTPVSVQVNGIDNLLLQENPKTNVWIPVCQVAADKLTDGLVVKNDVAWGTSAVCSIS